MGRRLANEKCAGPRGILTGADKLSRVAWLQSDPALAGEIESGQRHVIQKRLKHSGARWKEANLELAHRSSLAVATIAGSAVLKWPYNAAGFALEWSPTLSSPAWTNLPDPWEVIAGQNCVTNPAGNGPRFYRLHFQ